MSRDSNESRETKELLGRFSSVAIITPAIAGVLAYFTFKFLKIEINGANIRLTILIVWGLTILALGVSLYTHLKKRKHPGYERQVVTRMDWENRASRKSASGVIKAFIIIPTFSSLLLFCYHHFIEAFETKHEIRMLIATAVPLWIICCVRAAYKTRKNRIG